ncbi:MAG: hypothetical protein ACOC25_08490, partial [Alkalispirochaetaceae bacterium]
SLHTVDLEAETPGVEIRNGRWSGVLFTGVPVTLESTGVNLRDASFEPEGSVEVIERSRDRLSFYLRAETVLSLPRNRE